MTYEMIHIGNSAYVPLDKIRLVIPADSRKVKRILKNKGIEISSMLYWNTTGDLETRSLIVLDDGKLITSFVTANAINKRINQRNNLEVIEDD